MDSLDFGNIAPGLKARRQWLVWRFESQPGDKKPRKVPYYASGARRTGEQGSAADRERLVDFIACLDAAEKRKMDGIGFAFLPGDGLIGIDIDGAIDLETGEISQRAEEIIKACASYTERSPSGKGVHIIVQGETKSFKSNAIGLEVFCGSQFFTFTGKRWPDTPAEVVPIDTTVLRRLQATVNAAKNKPGRATGPAAHSSALPVAGSDRTKIESALLSVSPECGYDEWIQIGMAIHAALGDAGFAVWDYWSSKGGKYPGDKTLHGHWKSFKPGGGVTAATIFKMASQAGWRAPREPRAPTPKGVRPSPPAASADSRTNAGTRKPSEGYVDPLSEPSPIDDADFAPENGLQTPVGPDGSNDGDDDQWDWGRELKLTKGLDVKPVLHNLMLILKHHADWVGVLGFDQYSELIMKMRAPPWHEGTAPFHVSEWSEIDDFRLRHWLSTRYCEAKEKDVMQAVTLVAREKQFHPLIEKIEATAWDGVHRLRTWPITYLGACQGKEFENLDIEERDRIAAYTERAGVIWMVAAIARVYVAADPSVPLGAQVDTMLILEGPQGIMKSSALRVLGGEWFTDERLDFNNKDSLMVLQGRWIVEMAELEGLNKAESSSIKQFIPKRQDLFRLPYGRMLVKKPRRCIFAGTVNHDAYLKDDSGNRRFLPIVCTKIDIEALKRDVDQLWAEALQRYRDKMTWWIEEKDRKLFAEEQEKRYQEDAWQEPIEGFIGARTTTSTAEVMAEALKIDSARWDKMSQMRVGAILRRMGFKRVKIGGKNSRCWGYRRELDPSIQPEATKEGQDDAPF